MFNANLATRRDSYLPIGDHPLARLNTLFNHHEISLPLAERYRPLFRRRVLLDDVNVRSLRRHLRRYGGDQHSSANCAQDEPNIDEAPWPKAMSFVGNRRAQTHLPGSVLHRIVQKRKLSGN